MHSADSFFLFRPFLLSPPSVAGRTHIKQLSEGIEVNFCWLAALSGGSVVLRVASERLLLDRWEGLFSKSQECFEKSLRLGGIHASFTTESVTLRTERLITGAPPAGHYSVLTKNLKIHFGYVFVKTAVDELEETPLSSYIIHEVVL